MWLLDSVNVWHVSRLGNDGNSGHAAQYPVNLAADAKLTIGAAVTAAASGDTIVIWPGTYAESLTLTDCLTMIGVGKNVVISSSVNATPTITMANDCQLINLTIQHAGVSPASGEGKAVYSTNKTRLEIVDCKLIGTGRGCAFLDSTANTSIIISNCIIEGAEYGASIQGNGATYWTNCIISNSIVITTGWSVCNSAGIYVAGNVNVVVRGCSVCSRGASTAGAYSSSAIQAWGTSSLKPLLTVESCSLKGRQLNAGNNAYGIYISTSYCTVSVVGGAVDGTTYDINNASASVITVVGCCYVATNGTIISVDPRLRLSIPIGAKL